MVALKEGMSKPDAPSSPWWKDALLTLGCLLLVLVFLFREGFDSDKVVFANDAPLGAIQAHAHDEKYGWSYWQDLNWVGGELPSAMPNFTKAFFEVCLFVGGDNGAVLFAKWYQPLSLVVLGFCAWLFFRSLNFRQPVCLLGGLAAALNGDFFTYACWGLPSVALGAAGAFLAMAGIINGLRETGLRMIAWVILGGLGLGQGVMESFDVGGIFSLYVALFVVVATLNRKEKICGLNVAKGTGLVAVLALSAALMAGHALSNLIGIEGKAAAQQQYQMSPEQKWNFATQWSLPKTETLRVAVPGLFGYRLDSGEGGRYWGSVGQSPGWKPGMGGLARHSGYGIYAGMFVLLVCLWAMLQAFRGEGSQFDLVDRRWIFFWAALVFVSVLFAWGRHAFFYSLLHPLPFFSSIRNPIKFMHPASLALVVLFAYGLEGMACAYLNRKGTRKDDFIGLIKQWFDGLKGWDRRWFQIMAGLLVTGVLAWVFYAAVQSDLSRHLAETLKIGPDGEAIARFSLKMLGVSLGMLFVVVLVVIIFMSGVWSGSLAWRIWVLCGAVMLLDFGRAHGRYLIHENYVSKYATNPVIEDLRQSPHENRVKLFPGALAMSLMQTELIQLQQQLQSTTNRAEILALQTKGQKLMQQAEQVQLMGGVYRLLWAQHLFPYYQIQSLDIIQEPRVANENRIYRQLLPPNNPWNVLRLCELTGARFLLGLGSGSDSELDMIYGKTNAFTERLRFSLVPKELVAQATFYDFTATVQTNGLLALIEFRGALPRAGLFSSWRSGVSDNEVLATLPRKTWNPHQEVLISEKIPAPEIGDTNSTVVAARYESYDPKRIVLTTEAKTSTVLLLNDKHHPAWKVTVDGRPAKLLRANYLMRGVHLTAGKHEVEFRFSPSENSIRLSLSGFGLGALAILVLAFLPRPDTTGPLDDPEKSRAENIYSPDEHPEPLPRKSRSRNGRHKKR